MASPYNANGKNGISVADAKAYIATIKTDAIENQIAHYKQVATSLNTLAQSVTTINSNLQETWSGIAADAANKKFGTVAGQASNMALILSETVVPTLSAVHTGALSAQAQIRGVQDEVTQVHNPIMGFAQANTGIVGSTPIAPVVSSKASTPPVVSNSTLTPAEAVAFNAKQRVAAASAMNAAALSYSSGASTFNRVATGLTAHASASAPATVGFTLTPPSGDLGSSGAAADYQSYIGNRRGISNSGSAGVSSGNTEVQDSAPPTPISLPPPMATVPLSSPLVVDPPPTPVLPEISGPSDFIDDPPITSKPATEDLFSGNANEIDPITGVPSGNLLGKRPGPSTPGLFGEGGWPGSLGIGEAPGVTGLGAPASVKDKSIGGIGGFPEGGQAAEQFNAGMLSSGIRGVGGGCAEDVGGISGRPSANYLRGRYFAGEGGAGQPSTPWDSPAIGGSESILIGAQPVGGAGVTSVYAGARDSQGNLVDMMGGGGFGGGRSCADEKEESGPRPDYLKEDPQWWMPEGFCVPPVVA